MQTKEDGDITGEKMTLRSRLYRRVLLKESFRILGAMAGCHVVCIVLLSLMLSEQQWLAAVSSAAVLIIYFFLAWADGASRGEKSAAMNEMVASQRETYGREPDENQRAVMYDKKSGMFISLAAVLFVFAIGLLLGLVVLFLLADRSQPGVVQESFRLGYRLLMTPFLGLFSLLDEGIVSIILPVCALLFPAAELIGYLSGPRQRKKVHSAIQAHAERIKKKQAKEQANKKRAAQGPPKR